MKYMVLSRFQLDPQSKPEWRKCFVHKKYNKCVVYCKEQKANGSYADFFVYEEGKYPIGYLVCHHQLDDYKPLFSC